MNRPRGNAYLLTGFLLGLGLGLLYAWVISPVQYVDTEPASLRADFKDAYRALIAAAYAATGDLERARARLALLHDPDPVQALTAQAQRTLATDPHSPRAYALGLLAAALRGGPTPPPPPPPALTASPTPSIPPSLTPTATATASPTPSPTPTHTPTPVVAHTTTTPRPTRTPTLTRTPTPTLTPLASPTPTATPLAVFRLVRSEPDCAPSLAAPLLRVWVLDAAGQPLPGVALRITWGAGQQETFVTGLKPEISPGYADYELTPGVEYTLQVAAGSQPAQHILSPLCEATGEGYQGGWQVVFRQP